MKGITVQVLSYEKYKGRGDVKHNSWFRCSNRLLEDPDFYEFTHAELLVWVYILSLASIKNSSEVFINFDRADKVCRLKKKDVLSAIKKLEGFQIAPIDDTYAIRARHADDTLTCATNTHTGQTEQTNNNAQPDGFAEFWSGYPRKVGKSKAEKIWDRERETGAEAKDLLAARDNYRKYCESNHIEARFIKHGSTFLGEWRDWLDADHGSSEDFSETQALNPDDFKVPGVM